MSTRTAQHHVLIGNILQDILGLQTDGYSIQKFDRARHSYVYLIQLVSPVRRPPQAKDGPSKPYTSTIPVGTSRMVFSIPRGNVSLEESVRVLNEVAFLYLARDALSSTDASLIPRVYGWEDTTSTNPNSGVRWILEEWKEGEVLSSDEIRALENVTQRSILRQVARFVKTLQDYQLPDSVSAYGGLTFDLHGAISNTAMTIPCGGPFDSYTDLLRGMCHWQLNASDRSTHLNGWRDVPKLRERIDSFYAHGLEKALAKLPEYQPTLIHGDICLSNLLFDRSSFRLTAVLDFDFAHIGAPVSEYVFSFTDWDGILPGSAESMGHLQRWMLNGFPDDPNEVDSKWKFAHAWEDALSEAGVERPSTIEGAGDAADIWWFSQDLCQAFWFIDDFVGKMSPEALDKSKAEGAHNLDKYLSQWGF